MALKLTRKNNDRAQHGLIQHFHRYQHFSFDRETRPSDEVFLSFLEKCKAKTNLAKWRKERREIMGAIYLYQKNKISSDYQTKCALALIRNMNSTYSALVEYSVTDKSLKVESRKHFLAHGKFSMYKAMQQLPLDSVTLEINGIMAMENLKGTSVKNLDISKVKEIMMIQKTNLPNLEYLRMRKGQFTEDHVRKHLLSDTPFVIEFR